MKDRSSERGIGSAVAKYFEEMSCPTGTAGSNDRNAHRLRNRSRQVAIKSNSGSVPIHGSQQDLARSTRLGFQRPFQHIATSGNPATMGISLPARLIHATLSINRH